MAAGGAEAMNPAAETIQKRRAEGTVIHRYSCRCCRGRGSGTGGREGMLRLCRNCALCAAVLALAGAFGAAAAAAFSSSSWSSLESSASTSWMTQQPSSSKKNAPVVARLGKAQRRGVYVPIGAALSAGPSEGDWTAARSGWFSSRAAHAAAAALFPRRRAGFVVVSPLGSTRRKAEEVAAESSPVSEGTGDPASSAAAFGGDKAEWSAVVDALRMYRAAYGDLKVPSRFVVPGMAPWPEAAWGLKLGQRVSAIRATGKYVQNDESRRRVLDDMGFLWRLRAPSQDKKMDGITFDQIYDALETYKKVVEPDSEKINVPANFVIPNSDPWPESTRGMPLGKKIPAIRSKAYLKANPVAANRLAALGFEFDGKVAANDQRYRNVYDALVRYKELNGDLLVPQPYVVPENSPDWPEDMWGLRLGARVNAIRSQGTFVKTNPDRRQELDDLGFVWDLPASAGRKRGRKRKVENEALMGPAPPGILEGRVSGISNAVDGMRANGATGDVAEESAYGDALFAGELPGAVDNSLFPFSTGRSEEVSSEPIWAFEEDEDEEESVRAAAAGDEYQAPRDLASTLKDAAIVAASVGVIREASEGSRIQKGKIEKNIPWYIDDFGQDFVFEDVVEALTVYKRMYGNFDGLDDVEFIVPDPAEALFDSQAGLRIPEFPMNRVADKRDVGVDRSDEFPPTEMDRMELEMQPSTTMSLGLREETDATEEGSAVAWPEHLSGMRLGIIVKRIREGSLEVKHLRERRRVLDAIGFDWGDPKLFLDIPFEKTMCALLAYYQIRGDTMVYEDFVIPNEVPWPKVLAGYELGKAVLRIRQLQNFFEAYHPDKVTLLSMVEFYWFPEFSLPLDPFSWGETIEDEFIAAVGVPFYWLGEQENYPLGITEKLLADGPSDYPDDTAQWYNYEYVRDFWEAPTGTEVIKMFDETFGFHLPAYVLRRFGLPKLAKYQEAKFASGKLGEIASERLEVEKQQDDLFRPIILSMAEISKLKDQHEELSEKLSSGEINNEIFEKEKTSIEWKIEDIISRLQGISREFQGGFREEAYRVVERTEEFGRKLAAYEADIAEKVENIDEELQKRFPDYDKDEWERRQKTAAQLGAAEFARLVGEDEAMFDLDGEDVEEEDVDDEEESSTASGDESEDEDEEDDEEEEEEEYFDEEEEDEYEDEDNDNIAEEED